MAKTSEKTIAQAPDTSAAYTRASGSLEKMTLTELHDLRDEIDELVEVRAAAEKEDFKREMAMLAATKGLDLADIFGTKRGSIGVAKYRNPDAANETWTGRGRKPQWIADQIAKGKKLSDFVINP